MPLGGSPADLGRFLRARHAMVSFAYPQSLPVVADVCQSFVLDNGAFTNWKRGGTVDVKAYAAWVSEWNRHPGFDWCLIPDVIDGTEADNIDAIQHWTTHATAWIDSVPVWHLHESLRHLQNLAGRFRTVALGSSGQWAQPDTDGWWQRMGEAMAAVCDGDGRPRCKLHGLRMLNPNIFRRLPLASADSTNAAQNNGMTRRFGMYPPPNAWQRAAVIADRIESAECAAVWQASEQPEFLLAAE